MDSKTVGSFTFNRTAIDGVFVVDVNTHDDSRGYFMETYKEPDFLEAGITAKFVQDNQSSSVRGVLRGLHFQIQHPQSKLVRVISGEVFDVAVDLRQSSQTFGQWVGVTLSAKNRRQLFIPQGFAHGYLVLSSTAEFVYKCDDIYHPGDEGGIMWNDSEIAIAWPSLGCDYLTSEKDSHHPSFSSFCQKLS